MAPLTREQTLSELRRRKADFEQEYGVTRIGIFGSFARDEAGEESDVDVVVELREPDLFSLVHIKETLSEDLRRKVDIVSLHPGMNEFLRKRIMDEAIYV
jgi:uncharacterized protein